MRVHSVACSIFLAPFRADMQGQHLQGRCVAPVLGQKACCCWVTDTGSGSERRGQTQACAEAGEGVCIFCSSEHDVLTALEMPCDRWSPHEPHAWLVTPAEESQWEVAPREFISTGLKSYGALGAFDD